MIVDFAASLNWTQNEKICYQINATIIPVKLSSARNQEKKKKKKNKNKKEKKILV